MERYLLLGKNNVLLDIKNVSSFKNETKEKEMFVEIKYFGGEKVSILFDNRNVFDKIKNYFKLKKIVGLMNKRK